MFADYNKADIDATRIGNWQEELILKEVTGYVASHLFSFCFELVCFLLAPADTNGHPYLARTCIKSHIMRDSSSTLSE